MEQFVERLFLTFALLVEPLLKRFHRGFALSQVERTYAMIAITSAFSLAFLLLF